MCDDCGGIIGNVIAEILMTIMTHTHVDVASVVDVHVDMTKMKTRTMNIETNIKIN